MESVTLKITTMSIFKHASITEETSRMAKTKTLPPYSKVKTNQAKPLDLFKKS